ncbi:hypothetical protein GUJ93_ZPchr0010g8096 [Zizania palustris]|uniref:Uncharacterized protein n=1 Tax=Zizania palustris TaxID=103762 RepID=A0A8J5W8I3_ZIZPA|nr:hypothetical protein GUJ93_ZPchr0010g8096 [Zizania palustris]
MILAFVVQRMNANSDNSLVCSKRRSPSSLIPCRSAGVGEGESERRIQPAPDWAGRSAPPVLALSPSPRQPPDLVNQVQFFFRKAS